MNLRDHFSEKEIKNLNGLEKKLKIGKWVFAAMSVFMLSFSFGCFFLVYKISKEHGFEFFLDVLGSNFTLDKEYPGVFCFVNYVIAAGLLCFALLINNFVEFIFLRKYMEPNLVRCWKLLSSLSADNQDFGKSLK